MNVLFVTSECVPFAKTGGLADVAGALPKGLKNKGVEVCTVMPLYKNINQKKYDIQTVAENLYVNMDGRRYGFSLKKTVSKQGIVYFIENEMFFNRDCLYGTCDGAYADNAERFIFFCKAAIEFVKVVGFVPDIIHANDWQTALIPALLKTVYKDDLFFYKTKTVFTIHNMAYQGIFSKHVFPLTGMGWSEFRFDKIEYYDNINMLKAGIAYSDAVTTVSKRYAEEIQTPFYGNGLHELVHIRKNALHGILNGVDYEEWNPLSDKFISAKYSNKKIKVKSKCKKDLQKLMNLNVSKDTPVIAMISRIDSQKGFDLLYAAFDRLMELDVQFILLGTGDNLYYRWFDDQKEKYKGKVNMYIGFDEGLSHKIYAGADVFLMPSKFEPCGLSQLIACAYGTVPVVTNVGGLADTIVNYDAKTGKGSGFVMENYSSDALVNAVSASVALYKNKKAWKVLSENIMKLNFSWDRAATEYISLYDDLLK